MTTGRARMAFGLLAGVALAPSTSALGAAGRTAAAPSAVGLKPAPCSPRGDGVCTVSPKTLAVTFPTGTAGVSGVSVAWTTAGRPSTTAGPAQASVFLDVTKGGCQPASGAAPATCSWAWPSGLEATGSTLVLNGTYQVTPCTSAPPASCVAPASVGPAGLGIAAPPAPPGGVRASGPASAVTVTWAPGVEPDLAGYAVIRNDAVVFICSLHGASLPGSVPCGPGLAFTDIPGTGGVVRYAVVAKRLGVDSNPDHDLTSVPAVTSINLGSASVGGLPPAPLIGTPTSPTPGAPPNTAAGAGAGQGVAPTTTVDPGSGGLEYGPKGSAGALGALHGTESGHGTNVHGLALIAVGLLVLALAAHLLYLRGAVGRYQRAHGGPATGKARRRRRAPMRVQWGQWPPLIRERNDLSSPG